MEGKPLEIIDAQFQGEVLGAPVPVLVDFWAPWCGPCRMVAPVLEDVARDYTGKIKVVKLNVDDNPDTASRFGIMSIPTMILFKDGIAVEKIVGFRKKEELAGIIDRFL
ncbi:MAG TPA: thioredoxin [Firmicutes bacterium]|nr:thioredoxin [Bacillota bacterium]